MLCYKDNDCLANILNTEPRKHKLSVWFTSQQAFIIPENNLNVLYLSHAKSVQIILLKTESLDNAILAF